MILFSLMSYPVGIHYIYEGKNVPTKSDSDVILYLPLLSKEKTLYTSLELTRIDRSLVY